MKLEELGWNEYVQAVWISSERPGERAARVIAQHRNFWELAGQFGECRAQASGKLRLAAGQGAEWPAVGDWVSVSGEVEQGITIRAVLPRCTQIVRKEAGRRAAPQILAANVDTIFLLLGLDGDYKPRRIERYLTQLWDSGSRIVLLLNKSDICENPEVRTDALRRTAAGLDAFCISALTGEGVSSIESYLRSGQTIVLLGSSGVGKSTLLNRLMHAEEQATAPVRESDSRGRHTTTARQLFFLPGGAMVIDTPGLREIQLWDAGAGLTQAFGDVDNLARRCRFRDCTHSGEPGCAVAAAVEDGELDQERLENRRKLLREQAFLERKLDKNAEAKNRKQVKIMHRAVRQMYRQRDKDGKQ